MKTNLLILFFLFATIIGRTQQIVTDTIKAPASYENIHVVKIASDSLSTTAVLFIKKEVALHRHNLHTENVVILEGEGEMRLGDKTIKVKKGDLIVIPKGTAHSVKVTSEKPMKVLSVQSPNYDGTDREMLK